MPKFRSNHNSNSKSSGFIVKNLFVIIFLIAVILIGFQRIMKKDVQRETSKKETVYFAEERKLTSDKFFQEINHRRHIPISSSSQIVHHNYYSLGYSEDFEQAVWVSYELTKESILIPNVKRSNWFMEDGKVKEGSATYYDYSDKRFTRGHLAPAGDMAFNKLAMKESFLMSNMSPQIKGFNGGVWNELEQNVRDWAFERGEITVVSGPLFYDNNIEYIGSNRVAVPHAFYKALLDVDRKESIAFVIAHDVTNLPLSEFSLSVNDLEKETGIDFFSNYFQDKEIEEQIETLFDLDEWKFKKSRFLQRVNEWNMD